MDTSSNLRMSPRSRLLMVVAALALLLAFAFPIWKISLDAPQYPEGLGMYIHVNTVTGEKEHDLKNINNLNHYIGMKEIVPEAIPELKIMPWLIAFLSAFGLVVAAVGRRQLLYVWLGVFFVVMVVGLVDFYLWEYDYGHNLDQEKAIIKIPGMTYQPPLIGSKKLLNFVASSWPALGGWAIFGSFALGLGALWCEVRRFRPQPMAMAVLAVVFVAACSPGPRPIHYGEDHCAHCRMTLTDARYGAELVTRTGKVYVFDSVECLAAHMQETPSEDIHSLWVADFTTPEQLIPVEDAFFLHSERLHSPMGMNLTAFGPAVRPDSVRQTYGGDVLTWGAARQHIGHTMGLPAEDTGIQPTNL